MHKDAQASTTMLLDKLKASAANMQPTGVLCKQSNPAKEREDMFTYKLTKTIFASCYHFMAVAAALKLFQQGRNMLGFFFPNCLSPAHYA